MAIFILKESTNVSKISGTVLAFICTILLVFNQGVDIESNNMLLVGNILQLITAISYGTNALISKTVIHKISPFALIGWGMFVGSLMLFPISLASESQTWVGDLNIQAFWAMVFLAAFPALIATSLWYWVLERYELSKQMVFIYIMPFYAIIFSYILLDETISILALTLGVLTIIGVAVAQRSNFNKNRDMMLEGRC
jgi:drug/metabolite transporter (DMT)-like permease